MASFNGSGGSGGQPPQENRRSQNQRGPPPIPERRNEPPNRDRQNGLPGDDFNREAFNFHVRDVHSNISLRAELHNTIYTKFNRIIHLLKESNHGEHLWISAIQFTQNSENVPSFEQRSFHRTEEQMRRYKEEMLHVQAEIYFILLKLDIVYRKIYVSSRMIHCCRFDDETEKRLESEYQENKPYDFTHGKVLQFVESFFEMIKNKAITDNREEELPELVDNDVVLVGRNRNETGRERSANSKEVEENSDLMRDIREICDRYLRMMHNRPEERIQPPPSVPISEYKIQPNSSQRMIDEVVSNWKVTGRERSANSKEVEENSDLMRDIKKICDRYQTMMQNRPEERIQPPPSAPISEYKIQPNSSQRMIDEVVSNWKVTSPLKVQRPSAEEIPSTSTHEPPVMVVPIIRIICASPTESIDEMDLRGADELNKEEILNNTLLTPHESSRTLSSSAGYPAELESFTRSPPVDVEALIAQAEDDQMQPQALIEKKEQGIISIPVTEIESSAEEDEIIQMDDIETESTSGPQPESEPKLEEVPQAVQSKGNLIKQRLAQFECQSESGPKCEPVPRKSVDSVQESAKLPKESAHTSPEEDIKQGLEAAVETEDDNSVIGEAIGETELGIEPVSVAENKTQETQTVHTIPRPECPVGKQLLEREAEESEEALSEQDADGTDVPPQAMSVSTQTTHDIVRPVPRHPPPTPEERNPYSQKTLIIYGADYTGPRIHERRIPKKDNHGQAEATFSDDRKGDESSEILPDSKKGEESIKKAVESKEEEVVEKGNVEEATVKPDLVTIAAEKKQQVKEVPTLPKQDKAPGVLKGNTPKNKEPEREEKKGLDKPKSRK